MVKNTHLKADETNVYLCQMPTGVVKVFALYNASLFFLGKP